MEAAASHPPSLIFYALSFFFEKQGFKKKKKQGFHPVCSLAKSLDMPLCEKALEQ